MSIKINSVDLVACQPLGSCGGSTYLVGDIVFESLNANSFQPTTSLLLWPNMSRIHCGVMDSSSKDKKRL